MSDDRWVVKSRILIRFGQAGPFSIRAVSNRFYNREITSFHQLAFAALAGWSFPNVSFRAPADTMSANHEPKFYENHPICLSHELMFEVKIICFKYQKSRELEQYLLKTWPFVQND